jgi:hypothetical protein
MRSVGTAGFFAAFVPECSSLLAPVSLNQPAPWVLDAFPRGRRSITLVPLQFNNRFTNQR